MLWPGIKSESLEVRLWPVIWSILKGQTAWKPLQGKGTKPGSWNGWSSWSLEERGWSDGKWEAEKGPFFLPFPLLFHHHASGSSSSHPSFYPPGFWLIVPFFPCFSPSPFNPLSLPPYILLLPSLFLSVHDLLVISLNIVPPPSKKRAEVEAFGSMQDPFIVPLKGIKGKAWEYRSNSSSTIRGLNTGKNWHCILWEQEHVVSGSVVRGERRAWKVS